MSDDPILDGLMRSIMNGPTPGDSLLNVMPIVPTRPNIYNGDHPGDWCVVLQRQDLDDTTLWLDRLNMPLRHWQECAQIVLAVSSHGCPVLLTYKADGTFQAQAASGTVTHTHITGEPRPPMPAGRWNGLIENPNQYAPGNPDEAVDAAVRAMPFLRRERPAEVLSDREWLAESQNRRLTERINRHVNEQLINNTGSQGFYQPPPNAIANLRLEGIQEHPDLIDPGYECRRLDLEDHVKNSL